MAKYCPNEKCTNHKFLMPGGLFCTSCGTELRELDKCPSCKVPVSPYHTFCTNCGNEL